MTENILSYDRPAGYWEEALPLGNGSLGAMVYGGLETERCQLNLDRLWSGPFPDAPHPAKGPETIERVRKALDNDQFAEADELWKNCHGPYVQSYEPAADLWIDIFKPAYLGDGFRNYSRNLNLEESLCRTAYDFGRCRFARESFISHPDALMAIRITASEKGALALQLRMSSPHPGFTADEVEVGEILYRGRGPAHAAHRRTEKKQLAYDKDSGVEYSFCLGWTTDGCLTGSDNGTITIRDASEITLFLAGDTRDSSSPEELRERISRGRAKGYEQLKSDHTADVLPLYGASCFSLGEGSEQTTLERINRVTLEGRGDAGLAALYYNYGRYLMIAASRPGTQAMNLQGIWNDKPLPPWASNYTLNINTQMNYWPAELTGLSQLTEPLFSLMERLAVNGAETAQKIYGLEGWTAHHNSDYWAQTAPGGGLGGWDPMGTARWSCWNMGAAWLCQHLWQHYQFTGDDSFLKDKAFPLMKEAARFMSDWLVEDDDGTLVTSPSSSPENHFSPDEGRNFYLLSKGSTMDRSIVRDLFASVIDAGETLGQEAELTNRLKEVLPRLTPLKKGRYGQLQEWKRDWDDPKDEHRHISHLFALHPGREIILSEHPDLASACRNTLLQRGFAGTGWSKAWKINQWARLGEGQKALAMLKSQLKHINADPDMPLESGGVYANLFDAHPPFQIDGNFGGVSGIAEMLLQSHGGRIELLPALPRDWAEGSINGLCARGGFVLDLIWKESRLTEVTLTSQLGGMARVQSPVSLSCNKATMKKASGPCPNKLLSYYGESQNPVFLSMDHVYDIPTEKGETIILVTSD